MSQSDGYQYPPYVDTNDIMKNHSPIINGQSNDPNGTQSTNSNLMGTPSSQSSRDPSRETSRDPSPTHYLHNQYRPQLQRPPMPPIDGPIHQNPNIISPLPRQPQYNPIASPPNIYNQPNPTLPPNSNSLTGGMIGPPPVMSPLSSHQAPIIQPFDQIPITKIGPTLGNPGIGTPQLSNDLKINSFGPDKNFPWQLNSSPIVASNSKNIPNSMISNLTPPHHRIPALNQTNLSPLNSVNQNSLQNSELNNEKQSTVSTHPNVNQTVDQNSNQGFQHIPPSSSSLPRNQSQTINNDPNVNLPPKYISQHNFFANKQTAPDNETNIPKFLPNVNSGTQNIFTNLHQNENQNLVGPNNFSVSQNQSFPPKPPIQSSTQTPMPTPMQYNLMGGYRDSRNSGPMPSPSANIHGNQANLSGKKYPSNPYGTQIPTNTANIIANPMMPPPLRPNVPGSGQYQMRPPDMHSLSGPQMQTHQSDGQSQFPGKMANVPLEQTVRRYPAPYQDEMNGLNNQMSGMSVTQSGFNKLWGTEAVDLLKCRDILPPEKVEPPKIRLQQEILDSINCSPDIFRCTLTKVPQTNVLLQKSRLPLGVLIHPFKDLNNLAVIQCSTIVRCRACRTYINPFVYFVDSKRWKCNLCYRISELPEEFHFDPITKSYGDPSRRPEVKTSTIEFVAPSEYMIRPPQPAVYLFILDVSRLAVESGYLTIVCNTLLEELSRLPGDGRTQIGFLAVDSTVHFFEMPDNVSQPHEMIMIDVEDIFLPCPENLIVNLKEREELVRDLLSQLPTKFQGTHDTNNTLGAALQAAYKLVSPIGGRITVFQACLPNMGPGLLQAREDPNSRSAKDVPHLNPATDFYKRLALDCSGQQVSVDLFLLNSQYSDLATLSGMCKFSGGCIYHIPLFRASKPQHSERLEKMLRRYLTRKIGFEAVMRIRCTRGLSIHTFHGNFFVRSTDLLSLPNVNPDAGFGMQISIEENLTDVQSVCFQAALLYTSSKGERRIRVHTLCLPVTSTISEVLYSADQQCIIGLLSKMAVDRSQLSSISDARDAMMNAAIDALSAYKLIQSQNYPPGCLLAPINLKLLSLYINALFKSVAFRSGLTTRLDDRVFAMCQLKTLPLSHLIQTIYPDLYAVHILDDRNSKEVEGKMCPQAPRLQLSSEKIDSRGVFLMDAGDEIFIFVGQNINPQYCANVFGVPSFTAIPEECYKLPEFDNADSERLRNFIFGIQEEKPYYASVQIIKEKSNFKSLFTERLVEDRCETTTSYFEFLHQLKTHVK